MRFIGDVHGRWAQYETIADEVDNSIQVGDFGIGFGSEPPLLPPGHKFIRGNHDNPAKCQVYGNYMGDYGSRNDMFWAGGAYSIDRYYRTAGVDWWPEEELTKEQMEAALTAYAELKPRVMVSHMCPRSIEERLFILIPGHPNRTHQFLEGLLNAWTPKIWIFGHYHRGRDTNINGCRYICLPELAYIDLDV